MDPLWDGDGGVLEAQFVEDPVDVDLYFTSSLESERGFQFPLVTDELPGILMSLLWARGRGSVYVKIFHKLFICS